MPAKYGTPYFANYMNSDMDPSDIRSMCCRLRLDLRELRRRNGGFFGSGESTGSIGVVTLNLPHIAYISDDEQEFWGNLDHYMDIAARSLRAKKEVITKLLEAGLYPYTKAYLSTFANHFSTIGLAGGNEMCLNAKWLQKDLSHSESQNFTRNVLTHMRERLSDYQETYKPNLFNLEATPAESTAYRFAMRDKKQYPDIITANDEGKPYYTNSTHLPVGLTEDLFQALDIQDTFQPLYTSGTVFHTFLGEKLPSWESAAKLVKAICENYRLPYISITPTYSVCRKHGYIAGEHFICPRCGCEAEVYSRITGYYRPVKNWNDGKVQEYSDRKMYSVSDRAARTPFSQSAPAPEPHEHLLSKDNLLFTTAACPNCQLAETSLDKAELPYCVVAAETFPDLVEQYKIMQAPTLVCTDGRRYEGIGKIVLYVKDTLFHRQH